MLQTGVGEPTQAAPQLRWSGAPGEAAGPGNWEGAFQASAHEGGLQAKQPLGKQARKSAPVCAKASLRTAMAGCVPHPALLTPGSIYTHCCSWRPPAPSLDPPGHQIKPTSWPLHKLCRPAGMLQQRTSSQRTQSTRAPTSEEAWTPTQPAFLTPPGMVTTRRLEVDASRPQPRTGIGRASRAPPRGDCEKGQLLRRETWAATGLSSAMGVML